MNNVLSVVVFGLIYIATYIKYTDSILLKYRYVLVKEWIYNFLDKLMPEKKVQAEQQGEEEVDDIELEEVASLIFDFVIRNQEILSRIKVKDGFKGEEGTTK
tara:strand:+ start:434 stop:739 length:306 start_codon:yes stop_codon:yes gene_type:complete